MAETPNILLITADHMGWSTICGRSVCRTPNLNRLAQEGLRFDRSYTAVSVCCPSRAMLLSGAYPWHNGVFNQVHVKEAVRRDMFPDVVTYPRRLRDAGYRLGYVGKWHASALRGPMDFGYDVMREIPWLGPECAERLGPHVENSPDPAGGKPPRLVDPVYVTWPGGDRVQVCAGVDAPPAQDVSCRIAEAGARTIGEFAAGRQPWLVEVHFQQPHDPYRPLLCFLENYRLEDIELPRSYYEETFEGKPGLLAREASLWAELGEEDFRQALRHYYAFCEQVDHFAGTVLDALEATGQADDTLVVFAADHGDMVGAHRLFIKGWMPYEETRRIPMLARWPGVIPANSATDALVQLHDWAHTFAAVAGAPELPHPDGKNLLPLLRDPEGAGAGWPEHILDVYYGAEFLYTQRIAIGKRYKYVFNGFDWDEFYDLERDPAEVHNAVNDGEYAQAVQDMRDVLWGLMERYEDPYFGHRYGAARYLIGPRGGRHARPRGRESGASGS